jgi:hypothetical protein
MIERGTAIILVEDIPNAEESLPHIE